MTRKKEARNPPQPNIAQPPRHELVPPSRNHQAAASLFPDLEFFSKTTLRKLERKARIGHAGAEQVNYDDSFVSESVYYELPMNVNGSSFFSFEEMCQISLRMSSLWHWIEVLCKLKRKTSEMNFVH